jgi:hypothetical protein
VPHVRREKEWRPGGPLAGRICRKPDGVLIYVTEHQQAPHWRAGAGWIVYNLITRTGRVTDTEASMEDTSVYAVAGASVERRIRLPKSERWVEPVLQHPKDIYK